MQEQHVQEEIEHETKTLYRVIPNLFNVRNNTKQKTNEMKIVEAHNL